MSDKIVKDSVSKKLTDQLLKSQSVQKSLSSLTPESRQKVEAILERYVNVLAKVAKSNRILQGDNDGR